MDIETTNLSTIQLNIARVLPDANLEDLKNSEMTIKLVADNLVLSMRKYIHGLEKETIIINEKWPVTWWDAFKDRWFSKLLKDIFPVQYKEIRVYQRIYEKVFTNLNEETNHLDLVYYRLSGDLKRNLTS